jgi:hypothetical protein
VQDYAGEIGCLRFSLRPVGLNGLKSSVVTPALSTLYCLSNNLSAGDHSRFFSRCSGRLVSRYLNSAIAEFPLCAPKRRATSAKGMPSLLNSKGVTSRPAKCRGPHKEFRFTRQLRLRTAVMTLWRWRILGRNSGNMSIIAPGR